MLLVSRIRDILLLGVRGVRGVGGRRPHLPSEALDPFEGLVGQHLLVLETHSRQNKHPWRSLCREGIDGADMKQLMELGGMGTGVAELFKFPHGQRERRIGARP